MNEVDIRAAEQDCTRLITGYCQATDRDDVEAFVALFTTDGEWTSPTGSIVKCLIPWRFLPKTAIMRMR